MRKNPAAFYGLVALAIALVVALLIWRALPSLELVWPWLIAVNATTLLTYGYDKSIAGTGRTRVPEWILLALTFFGGTVGALAGMLFFRHKTRKWQFQIKFWPIVVLQFVLFVVYWMWLKPQMAGAL
jgi:uncharacterized membrane protein YsdA (DUF1294 family)